MDESADLKPIKGRVGHELKIIDRKTIGFRLLKTCVLRRMVNSAQRFEVEMAKSLQRDLQYQNYRLLRKNPNKRLALTYRLNCRPVGFSTEPWTRVCNRARFCPWCFVRRRLLPAYKALMSVPKDIRVDSQVIGWRRMLPLTDRLPFFQANYGPHQWCNAKASVQIVMPWFHPENDRLIYYHCGLQIVSRDCLFRDALTRRAVEPALESGNCPQAFSDDVVKIISDTMALPWTDLFCAERFEQFEKLVEVSEISAPRLLRIQPYRP